MEQPHDRTPLIAITLGDIAGVGPEIVAKALADSEIRALCRPAVFGPLRPLSKAIKDFAEGAVVIERVASAPELAAWDFARAVPVVDDLSVKAPPCRDIHGRVDAASGRASHAAVVAAADACLAGHAAAMVTAPIHKEAWAAAGAQHPGHTELLAERSGVGGEVMMLAGPRLRVTLVTIHVPLAQVPALITRERVRDVIRTTAASMPLLGVSAPRVAVAGLNPHAGEGGLFGDEEARAVAPAIEDAQSEGIDAMGPHPGDTVFGRAVNGEFDVVVAMYHDQGLAPIKVLDFERTVNITLGLPIIRTSVDHGTAFDIAGKGIADPGSLCEAIRVAVQMARSREE